MTESKGRLFLARHGATEWTSQHRLTGWEDLPISEIGKEESYNCGAYLKKQGIVFDRAYTSDLLRASQTLDIILDIIGQKNLSIISNSALREQFFGSSQGASHMERRSTGFQMDPAAETAEDFRERVHKFFYDEINPKLEEGEIVLVVTHQRVIREIVTCISGNNGASTPDFEKWETGEVRQVNI
ncbi:histidine phosphatase family protein [Butyrivibrio sp. MC2013]|uniref:histidine phosphatase family protein n=1 Tax=Butyrivibrio sp. MC2013 TaxID=1280686 RepID=UPI0006847B97|nr:histidine phosphatase family protein [Butyrivibrio sp. MC2013]